MDLERITGPLSQEEKRCRDQAALIGASSALFAFAFTVFRKRPNSAQLRTPSGMFLVSTVTSLGGYGVYAWSYARCRERAISKPVSEKVPTVV